MIKARASGMIKARASSILISTHVSDPGVIT